mgnify:CR=1 FL=1
MRRNARIYIMKDRDGRLKLGHSVNPERRAKVLGNPEIVYQTDVLDEVERIERLAHKVLALHGTHIRAEWFDASVEAAITAIQIARNQAECRELPLGGKLKKFGGPKPIGGKILRLQVPQRVLDMVDSVKSERGGGERTTILREAMFLGLKAMIEASKADFVKRGGAP